MGNTLRTTVAAIAAILVFIILGSMLYRIGEYVGELQRDVRELRTIVESLPMDTYTLQEAGYYDNEPKPEVQFIEDLLENLTTANISINYDSRGFQEGSIHIYLEKQKACSLCDKISMWMSSENATEMTIIIMPKETKYQYESVPKRLDK